MTIKHRNKNHRQAVMHAISQMIDMRDREKSQSQSWVEKLDIMHAQVHERRQRSIERGQEFFQPHQPPEDDNNVA